MSKRRSIIRFYICVLLAMPLTLIVPYLVGETGAVTWALTNDVAITSIVAKSAPGGPIQSDDFNTCTLSAFWTHFPGQPGDPGPVLSGTHVSMFIPAGADHDIWEDGTFASRIMQAANNTNFEVEVKFDSPVTERFQTQGVLVEQANGDALRFEFHHDGSSNRFYAASIISSTAGLKHNVDIGGSTPPYMKVTRAGDLWTQAYSFNGSAWTTKSFTQVFTVARVGAYGGNVGTPPPTAPAHTVVIDYFYNTAAPGSGDVDENNLTVNINGNGSVDRNPDKPAYSCGEEVELTANPAIGWHFSGWSGDLGGSTTPEILTISGDHVITATFAENPPAVNVTETGGSTIVSEDGLTDTYQVVLNSPPTAMVTINFTTNSQLNPIPSLTFDNTDWDQPKNVTVSAVDDDLAEASPHLSTIHHSASSSDPDYNGISPIADVVVKITDNDSSFIYLPLVIRVVPK